MKCDEGMLDIIVHYRNSGLLLIAVLIEFLDGANLACLIVFRGQWTSPLLLLDRHIFEHCGSSSTYLPVTSSFSGVAKYS